MQTAIKSVTVRIVCVVSILAALASLAQEAQPNPNIGRDAPALEVKEWATEKRITQESLKDRPYVLELWATWCPPCRVSIPHLNELFQQVNPFGVPIIGLSDEAIEKVKPFAAKIGMVYYVGTAAKIEELDYEGIPFATIVGDDGKISWAGHPMDPEFTEHLFEVTRRYRPDLAPAIEEARKGDMKAAYDALGQIATPEAETARREIMANLENRLEFAESQEGIEKYTTLARIKEMYDGLGPAAGVPALISALAQDPVLQTAIKDQQAASDLQKSISELQKQATALQSEKSQIEAAQFYFGKLIPILEEFTNRNPEHEITVELKNAIPILKEQLQKLEQQPPANNEQATDEDADGEE